MVTNLMTSTVSFFPLILKAIPLAVFIGTKNHIDLPMAFTIVTIFGIIDGPVRALPSFIGSFLEFTVSMTRI